VASGIVTLSGASKIYIIFISTGAGADVTGECYEKTRDNIGSYDRFGGLPNYRRRRFSSAWLKRLASPAVKKQLAR